jgi:hypothetical protein
MFYISIRYLNIQLYNLQFHNIILIICPCLSVLVEHARDNYLEEPDGSTHAPAH